MFAAGMLALVCGTALGAEPTADELLTGPWQRVLTGPTAVLVEFGMTRENRTFRSLERFEGKVYYRHAPGTLTALRVELWPVGKPGAAEGLLLSEGKLYCWQSQTKTAYTLCPGDSHFLEFLLGQPSVGLLDATGPRNRSARIELAKRDEWYSYLTVKSTEPERKGWFRSGFARGRIVLLNKESTNVPKGFPVQLWTELPAGDCETIEVRKIVFDPPDARTWPVFTPFEELEGWTVSPSVWFSK